MNEQTDSTKLRPFVDHAYAKIPQNARMLRSAPGWVWAFLSIVIIVGLILFTQILAGVFAAMPMIFMGEEVFEQWFIAVTL